MLEGLYGVVFSRAVYQLVVFIGCCGLVCNGPQWFLLWFAVGCDGTAILSFCFQKRALGLMQDMV